MSPFVGSWSYTLIEPDFVSGDNRKIPLSNFRSSHRGSSRPMKIVEKSYTNFFVRTSLFPSMMKASYLVGVCFNRWRYQRCPDMANGRLVVPVADKMVRSSDARLR
jgi:hypothetical protein